MTSLKELFGGQGRRRLSPGELGAEFARIEASQLIEMLGKNYIRAWLWGWVCRENGPMGREWGLFSRAKVAALVFRPEWICGFEGLSRDKGEPLIVLRGGWRRRHFVVEGFTWGAFCGRDWPEIGPSGGADSRREEWQRATEMALEDFRKKGCLRGPGYYEAMVTDVSGASRTSRPYWVTVWKRCGSPEEMVAALGEKTVPRLCQAFEAAVAQRVASRR